MANQYDVLGKAPGLEDLNKLSPNDVHLTIRGLNAGYGKMEIQLLVRQEEYTLKLSLEMIILFLR